MKIEKHAWHCNKDRVKYDWMKCETCFYWWKPEMSGMGHFIGDCRYKSPTTRTERRRHPSGCVEPDYTVEAVCWPSTREFDWCGCWKPAKDNGDWTTFDTVELSDVIGGVGHVNSTYKVDFIRRAWDVLKKRQEAK